MSNQSFNKWQEHIAKELQKNYSKLKLIKQDGKTNVQRVPRKKS